MGPKAFESVLFLRFFGSDFLALFGLSHGLDHGFDVVDDDLRDLACEETADNCDADLDSECREGFQIGRHELLGDSIEGDRRGRRNDDSEDGSDELAELRVCHGFLLSRDECVSL